MNKTKYVKTEIEFSGFQGINNKLVDQSDQLKEEKQALVYSFFLQSRNRLNL